MALRTIIILTGTTILLSFGGSAFAQEVVIDYDGNEYHSISIGDQVWLQENLNSLHYSDGTDIPDVVAYDNSVGNARIYGRLYTWDAAMRDVTTEGAQGICPEGWHIPSNAEWSTLEDYLGGVSVAGGKLKEAGLDHWSRFNTGADNSSGFTALPGGEYDDHDSPHQFRLINDYAVFWTSTQTSTAMASERYLAYNSAESFSYNWYKIMKYSIRAIRDTGVSGLSEDLRHTPHTSLLHPNYPNPFNPTTTISLQVVQTGEVSLRIYDIKGSPVQTLVDKQLTAGLHKLIWDGMNAAGKLMDSGVYLVVLRDGFQVRTQKISLIR